MTQCRRQCDWDKNMICKSCGIDYSLPDSEEKQSVVDPPKEAE
ncbi:MAG: hypothetical protein P8Q55_05010 [Candidatus Poseidoniaceae archaeon]|nr:hypothetical protein [Candidatus Poseidoniaceae archaeon]